jgi:hypothetical protein
MEYISCCSTPKTHGKQDAIKMNFGEDMKG